MSTIDSVAALPLRPYLPRCRYGVDPVFCGAPASTKRQRPAGGATWDVCQRHAVILDRVRSNVAEHAGLLARLAAAE